MTEQKIQTKMEEKTKTPKVKEDKVSTIAKEETITQETKTEKKVEVKKVKKEEAIVNGLSMHASKKQCMYICKFIKNKKIDAAIADLEQVMKLKKVVPFKGEIPHRSAPGVMSGRYPVKVSGQFIYLLKGLKGNSASNGLDLEKTRITFASASWAARHARSNGKAKRTNVVLKATEIKSSSEKGEKA